MLDEQTQKEILESIAKHGKVNIAPLKVNIDIKCILNTSSGAARIQPTVVRKAKLILGKPKELEELSPQQIRCCLCHKAISYPCWYYDIRYNVNQFHYFMCFDPSKPDRPTVKCYRRT